MKILDIRYSEPLIVKPLGNRYYSVANKIFKVAVCTDEGVFDYDFLRGFETNFRSGGIFVDRFVDQIGDEVQQVCWLVHDANYTPCEACKMEHPVSRKLADELLRAMLVYADIGNLKAGSVYYSVRLFGASAYNDDDELTEENSKLFSFSLSAK